MSYANSEGPELPLHSLSLMEVLPVESTVCIDSVIGEWRLGLAYTMTISLVVFYGFGS